MLRIISLCFLTFLLCIGSVCIAFLTMWERFFGRSFSFPHTLAELQTHSEWCIQKFQATDVVPEDIHVEAWNVSAFQEESTFRSHMAKIELIYTLVSESNQVHPPQYTFHCLAKCAPTQGSLWNRIVFILQGNHVKEVGFYRDLSARLQSSVPRCYGSDIAVLSGHFCILMEYIENAEGYTEHEGCPDSHLPRVMRSLALMHATFWDLGSLKTRPDWLQNIPEALIELFLIWGKELDAFLGQQSRVLWTRSNLPMTVLHGDARIGNMLFPKDGTQTILYDWQATRLGNPALDVAYFLVLSVDSEVRAAKELEVLQIYHQALCEQGISGYDWSTFLEDYRMSCLHILILLGLPFLSSEISVEDPINRYHALSGGVIWSKRIHQMIEHLEPEFIEHTLQCSPEFLLRSVEQSMLHPHKWNHGSWLVADFLQKQGGIAYLKAFESLSLEEFLTEEMHT